MSELPVAEWAPSVGLPAKQRVRQAFDQAASTYDAAADVQREVCDRLAAYWQQSGIELEPDTVLDAGGGTGYGGRWLAERWPQARLALIDFAPGMLIAARMQASRALLVCADIEALPLPDRCCEPVSYTHLDVYKRQVLARAATLRASPIAAMKMGATPESRGHQT